MVVPFITYYTLIYLFIYFNLVYFLNSAPFSSTSTASQVPESPKVVVEVASSEKVVVSTTETDSSNYVAVDVCQARGGFVAEAVNGSSENVLVLQQVAFKAYVLTSML